MKTEKTKGIKGNVVTAFFPRKNKDIKEIEKMMKKNKIDSRLSFGDTFKYDIYLICPVRNATPEQKIKMQDYINEQEELGMKVYYPTRDNPYEEVDKVGWDICTENKEAIQNSEEVHIFWDSTSTGSLFDLGIAFGSGKKLTIVNKDDVDINNKKSFTNMISFWDKL